MIAPLMFALAFQAKPVKPAAPPILPPMSSAVFQESVIAVEKSLEAGDFEKAKKQAALLPQRYVSISYDDRKLPEGIRQEFRMVLARAIKSWRNVAVTVKPKGDIRISFQPQLAPDADTGAPANVALFFSDAPSDSRLEAVIGLKRANPLRPTTAADFASDVKYAIGSYLGLSKISIPGRAMNGSETGPEERGMSEREQGAVFANLQLSNVLRQAAETKKKLGISSPADVFIDPAVFEGSAVQGDEVELPIQITNRGKGTLAVSAEGDCGCIIPGRPEPVAPGTTGIVKARMETHELVGPVERQVYLYTNDPNRPAYVVKVKMAISPRYRFLMPGGNAVTVDDGGATFDVFLTYPDGPENEMKVRQATVIGMEGAKVAVDPWTGNLPDPGLNEADRPRQGYRLRVTVPGQLPPGRSSITLGVITDVQGFTDIYQTVYLQKGIVAQPEELFLGEVARAVKTSTILLTRPGRPFEVKSVKSSLKNFAVKIVPSPRADEVKLQVTYDGKAPTGQIEGEIVVETTDPKQPIVRVPIVGSTT